MSGVVNVQKVVNYEFGRVEQNFGAECGGWGAIPYVETRDEIQSVWTS